MRTGNAPHKTTGNESAAQMQTKRITATFYPIYIMCLNITDGVEGVTVSCLAPPSTGCLHDYTLTTRDAAALEECDIIVANGAGMESFLGQALMDKENAVIIASSGYNMIRDNPHIWVSVAGARHEVKTISAGLARMDSEHASEYEANAARYDNALVALEREMHEALSPFANSSIVTFHEAFPYFAREFSLNVLSVIEHEGGASPSAKEMAETLSVIKAAIDSGSNIALFAEPQYPVAAAALIAAETGLTVHSLDPCVTGALTKDAYITAERNNAQEVRQAFTAHKH